MNRNLKTLITIGITAVATFSATAIGFWAVNNVETKQSNTDVLKSRIDSINAYIENDYLYDDIDYEKANDDAIKAYVASLNEPYTMYFTPDEFDSYIERVSESYTGIGVVVSADMEKNKIVVVSPFIDSPAHKAGIKPGDYIVGVDDKKYDASKMNECISHIKNGKSGTGMELSIERNGEIIVINCKRGEITANSVTGEMLDNNIGYISITSFNTNTEGYDDNTYTEFVEEIEALKEKGMESLIIDVRDNPGGVIDVVCEISDYLLPEGIITYTETKSGKRTEYKSDKNQLDLPIAVLINGNSASASEILTGALKDFDKATVIGEKSYGKGIVQTVFPFRDGAGLSMTIAKYYTPSGVCIHDIGIEPDYVVTMPEKYKEELVMSVPHNEDTQLQKAIEILNK